MDKNGFKFNPHYPLNYYYYYIYINIILEEEDNKTYNTWDRKVSTSNPTIVNVLDGIDVKSVPIWLMRQAGRYLEEYRAVRKTSGSFLNLCYSPKMAKKVTLQPIERFNFDAAIIFSDILVIPDALGQSVQFQEGIGPVLEPLRDLSSLNCLKMDNVTNHLSPVYETISDVRSELTSDKAVIGFSGAPWTIATYMVEGGSNKDSIEKAFKVLNEKIN